MLRKIWSWIRKTYDYRDLRDYVIFPIILSAVIVFCVYVLKVKEWVAFSIMCLVAAPVFFAHALHDYNKKFHKENNKQ
jgi:hypothetical protein